MATLKDLPSRLIGNPFYFNVALPQADPDNNAAFSGDPEVLYKAMYGDLPEWGRFTSDAQQSGWQIDPSAGFTSDRTQIMPVGYDENGNFRVMIKSGDKTGTIYQYQPTAEGGMALNSTPIGTQEWNTNFADPMMWTMAAAAAVPGVAQLFGLPTTMPAIGGVGEIASMGPQFATLGGTGSLGGLGGFVPELMGTGAAPGEAAGGFTGSAFSPQAAIAAATGATVPEFFNPVLDLFTPTSAGGASTAGTTLSNAAKAVGGAANAASNVPDWLKLLAPVLGGALAYRDANDAEGPQGYGPALEGITGLMGKPWSQPQFSTGLVQPPQFSTSLNGTSGLFQPRKYY